jgi:hypothetical protein
MDCILLQILGSMTDPCEYNNAILVSIKPFQRLLALVLPLQYELRIVLYKTVLNMCDQNVQ